MLKLKNTINCLPICIEIDPYIAIKIIFGEDIFWSEPSMYWRFGDFKKQLIEIGIDNNTGSIREVTLVGIKNIHSKIKNFSSIRVEKGIPTFNKISYDKNRLFNEYGDLHLFVNKNLLQLFFLKNPIIAQGLTCDRVICFFDKEDNLCGFQVNNLTTEEHTILNKYFVSQQI